MKKKSPKTRKSKKKSTGSPQRLYADAAAATPIHPRVQKRIIELLDTFANPGALHKEAVAAKKLLEESRAEIARTIGAHPDEIFFTGSGTEANNIALLGSLYPLLRASEAVQAMTLPIEHQSVLEPLHHLKKYGLELKHLSVDEAGLVHPRDVAEAIEPHTALISVQLVNSEIGTIEPVRDIAKFIRYARNMRKEAGNTLPLYFHTDAAQAPLYLPIHVEKLGIDLMTLDAQKVEGPKSVGILYRRRGVTIEPILFGGRQERGFRPGTENAVFAAAFAEALSMAQKKVEERSVKIEKVRDALAQEILRLMPDTNINGTMKERIANNLNISIPSLEGETAVIALDALGIAISTRSACVTKDEEPSHVIKALLCGRDKVASGQRAREAIRITLLPNATVADAKRIAKALLDARNLYGKKERQEPVSLLLKS